MRLIDLFFNTMMAEARIEAILDLSPFKDIRSEAHDFIENNVQSTSSLRHNFQRKILEGTLNFYIQDIEQKGPQSFIYRDFYSHFTNEKFRRGP